MKYFILLSACLFLSACGSSSASVATTQTLDYFAKPVKVAMVVADQATGIQASELTITGVSRSIETVTLDFGITITNSGTSPQEISVTLSGRDRYNLEVLAPVITTTVQPGETRVVNQQQQFTAILLYQAETWTVQSVGLISLQQAEPVNPPAEPVTTPEEPQQPPVIPIATETSGAVQLLNIEPVENFRTADKVNFTTRFQFQNLSSTRINFHWTVNALTATDTLVFSRDLNTAINGGQSLGYGVSFGEPLTTSEYDSITQWTVTDFARY